MDATPGAPDAESPEITKALLDRGTVTVGDVVVRGPRKPGRPAGSGTKAPIHIMVDKDILAYYRATGAGWQTRMNAALRASLPKTTHPKRRATSRG
ncbi:MAG TPA: BrnA antitoxin family protein [bacterium]